MFQFPVGISRNLSCSATGAGGAFSAGFGAGFVSAGFTSAGLGAVSAGFTSAGLGAVSAGFTSAGLGAVSAGFTDAVANLFNFASKFAILASRSFFDVVDFVVFVVLDFSCSLS